MAPVRRLLADAFPSLALTLAGDTIPVVVRIHLDDPHTVDLYLFGPEQLIAPIRDAIAEANR